MKKFFLKGKEYLSKKLEELDIVTENLDLVNEQIPNRLREPLKILQKAEIDLESNEPYEAYFRNYPTHHLSTFLLQKFEMLVSANTPTPQLTFPYQEKDVFIPNFDKQLENKALLFRQVVEEYDQGYTKVQQPIICLAVIHFHHKRGTEIEYKYPQNKTVESIQNLIVHHAMPDSSHNKMQDYNFFNFEATIKNKKKMLFGVSYFKQIKVTEEMKLKNKEVTRSYIQKAVTVVSALPLFGYLKLRLSVTTKLFFQNFSNFQIIDAAYKELSKHLIESWPGISMNQLYIGSDLKVIINLFGVNEFYEIWKAILSQKRVVIFAHSSSSASSFILSLLTLFPGISPFGLYSKSISKHMQALRQYALPLRIFSTDNFMSMSFHIQDFHLLSKFQKTDQGSFLIGTTNRLLKQANEYGIEMLVNLENCTIEKKKARQGWEPLTKRQKIFIHQLDLIIETQKNLGYGGSEDMIRNHFHNFLKSQLVEIMKGIRSFKTFVKDCRQYETGTDRKTTTPTKKKQNDYEVMEEEEIQNSRKNGESKQFPPLLPTEVSGMPFSNLLLCSSFSYFLQFHNEELPRALVNQIFPTIIVDGVDYYLKLNPDQFIQYNWNDKRLMFGKGRPKNYQGKQIRFVNENHTENQVKVKSIYIGSIQNNKFSKNGYYLDKNQIYQGDFDSGVRQGYGKLTNSLHKYIGFFQNDLYSGQGQLVAGKQLYVGEFKEGMKYGCGKNQGEYNYDGEWVNNKAEGSGILKIEQKQFIGTFEKGYLNEDLEVTIRYENGSMYKGYVKNYIPEGRGYLVDENGTFTSGIFKSGKLVSEMQKPLQKTQEVGQQQVKVEQIGEEAAKEKKDEKQQNVDSDISKIS